MNYTANDVKTLRDSTGAGLLDCKKALNDTNGDIAAAEKLLKEKGLAAMAQRTDRTAAEGRIVVKQDGNRIAMVETLCETDFVSNNADFIAVAEKAAEITLEKKTSGVLDEHKALIDTILVKFRENMSVKRAIYVEVPAGCVASTYVHHDHKIGALVVVKGSEADSVKEFAHVCCLHLASNKPDYVTKDQVPQSYIDEQTEIFKAQMDADEAMAKKPENVKAGILQGKVNKLVASSCFMDQAYLDNEKITVAQALNEAGKAAGATLSFDNVTLYVLGK
ncbi:MAG: translation elongation factor Ts [Treponema sp.]|nr:translation elongation factor Ts [Treponema sp.]